MFDRILALAALIVLVTGVVGFMIEDLARHGGPVDLALFLRLAFQSFTQAVRLFWINISLHPETDNWLLMVARLCGAIVAAAAAFRLITTVFGRDYNAFKASFYKDHAVVLGYSLRNALLADSWRGLVADQRQIVLDHDAARVRPLLRDPGRLFFQADLGLPGALKPAGIARASLVLIATGSDERNLAIFQQVSDLREAARRPTRIVVTIDDAALADRCRNDTGLARLANGDSVHFHNHANLSARQLLARTPFADRALAAGQPRVRLLFAGFSETALEIIIQFLRVSPPGRLPPVRIDIVTPDRQSAIDLIIGRVPNLRHMLEEASGEHLPLSWAGKIHLHEANPLLLSHASVLASDLEKDGGFTAIVIAGRDTIENVKTALAIRSWTAGHPAFAAPIYLQAGRPGSLRKLFVRYDSIRPKPQSGPLAALRGTEKAGEAIEPFGMLEEICSPEFLFGERERLAMRLHEGYRQKRLQALRNGGGGERSDLPAWQDLDETYRQANRRAVDLLPVARLEAGIADWWDSGAGLPAVVLDDPERLEALSRLAHASWRADRELDGWRPGEVRDTGRRLHTDLVGYDELSEDKKELDREQIRLLARLQHA